MSVETFRFSRASFFCEMLPQPADRPMMRDAGKQRLEFLDCPHRAHLFHQLFQCFDGRVLE